MGGFLAATLRAGRLLWVEQDGPLLEFVAAKLSLSRVYREQRRI